MVKVYYETIDAKLIFGMVGRCGGGYNTVWEDWSSEGRIARENIMREYETAMNKLCGHYAKLEDSIRTEGIRNPVIINCGFTKRCKPKHVPPEIMALPPNKRFLLEGTTGGSRLWVAQKLNMPIKCFINDLSGSFQGAHRILTTRQALKYYNDVPHSMRLDLRNGIVESFDQKKVGHHLGTEWSEDKLMKLRAPIWVSIMNKYGYYVDRLPPIVNKVLADAGVIQPLDLKNKHTSH